MWPSLSILPTGGSFLCWVVIRNTSKPHHLWGWFLGFIIMVLKKIKGWILMYNHSSQLYWNESNNHLQNPLSSLWKPLILWGFWKNQNQWLLDSDFFNPKNRIGNSLILKKNLNWNWWFFENWNNCTALVCSCCKFPIKCIQPTELDIPYTLLAGQYAARKYIYFCDCMKWCDQLNLEMYQCGRWQPKQMMQKLEQVEQKHLCEIETKIGASIMA